MTNKSNARKTEELESIVSAIGKSQAMIEFELDGTIITANKNFLATVGYSLEEVQGQHHRMFVDSVYANSSDYHQFWATLARGEFQAAEYKRIANGGREIWIQASYNPIFDADGKPYKVIKFATDITEQKIRNVDYEGQIEAIGKAQAVIEFELDGTIITANENFLETLGYTLDEIQGQHHRMFVEPGFAKSNEYQQFWVALGRGEYQAAEYKRLGKGGREVWIQASYNPIFDPDGKPRKVVKFATDVTEQKRETVNFQGQIDAINKAQAVIEFELDGTIISANENFLSTVGYSLDEIRGQHHRMFVEPSYAGSNEYKQFWLDLASGQYQSAEYKRLAKGGREVWIQASYNPILDPDGRPYKVVKFATDITDQKLKNSDYEGQIAAIGRSQAVIEFELDGTIISANENFLNAMGYALGEVQGQHHRMFAEPELAQSTEYADFWASLRKGQFQAAEYKRIAKGGREVWIQASYNPIFDPDGNPLKVVKYATDITAQVIRRQETERVGKLVDRNLESILSSVTEVNQKSAYAASASTETAANVQAVAAASEEFSNSVREISQSVANSNTAVDQVVTEIAAADQSTQALSAAASSMNRIIELIQDVAGQIKLLALNATIESARAGEAGKGFAVVASEVKSLSNQVSSATNDIANEISSIQTVSVDVVEKLKTIQTAIGTVQSSVTGVAGAVEEQTATISDISSNMQTAASSVGEIESNLAELSSSVDVANGLAKEGLDMYRSIEQEAAQ